MKLTPRICNTPSYKRLRIGPTSFSRHWFDTRTRQIRGQSGQCRGAQDARALRGLQDAEERLSFHARTASLSGGTKQIRGVRDLRMSDLPDHVDQQVKRNSERLALSVAAATTVDRRQIYRLTAIGLGAYSAAHSVHHSRRTCRRRVRASCRIRSIVDARRTSRARKCGASTE
jgi:hypothetical protein